jgi:hypothetical protein
MAWEESDVRCGTTRINRRAGRAGQQSPEVATAPCLTANRKRRHHRRENLR